MGRIIGPAVTTLVQSDGSSTIDLASGIGQIAYSASSLITSGNVFSLSLKAACCRMRQAGSLSYFFIPPGRNIAARCRSCR